MTKADWIISLQNTAEEIKTIVPKESEVVRFILREHGAKSIYDLNPGDYEEVFSELYAYIENYD